MPRSGPIIVDNGIFCVSGITTLIGGSFAPIFPIKIDTCGRAINENVGDVLKSFAYY